MKNTKLRKQCADIIRYLRKHNRHGLSRPETEVDISSLNIDYHNLHNFVLEAQHRNIPLDEVYFRYSEELDYDDYTSCLLTLYHHTIMSDSEYFDYLCDRILPSEYEMNEYKQYLMLKNKYEGTSNYAA